MSKVVLLAINSKYIHSSLAVRMLASAISAYSRLQHDVIVIETTIHQDINEVAALISSSNPDVVGISTYIWNAAMLQGLLGTLKTMLPSAIIVLGGPEASHNAGFWQQHGADYVLRGEGEHSFPRLLDELSSGEAEPIEPSGALSPTNLSDAIAVIDPYSKEYMDALDGRIAYIETSRGCPFRCSFCMSAGSDVRFFPIDAAKERLGKLAASSTQTVKLVDRTFNSDIRRAYELFEHVIRLDTECHFHFEVAADLFDDRTISLLKSAPPGRIQLEAGLQSYFEPALRAASRHMNMEKADRNICELLDHGNIHVHVDLIAGLPYETLPDFQISFDRAFALGAHTLQLGFLKLLHGSEIRERAGEFRIRFDFNPPYEIISSPWLSAEDLHILKEAENALQRTYNKGRFLSTLQYVLSASGIRPFVLFSKLGKAAPNCGTHLSLYALEVYECLSKLPNVRDDELRDSMVRDWLMMVKGKNLPPFLRNPNERRTQLRVLAEKSLGRAIERSEAAVLLSGKGVFVDSNDRDPVTGLHKLHTMDFPA